MLQIHKILRKYYLLTLNPVLIQNATAKPSRDLSICEMTKILSERKKSDQHWNIDLFFASYRRPTARMWWFGHLPPISHNRIPHSPGLGLTLTISTLGATQFWCTKHTNTHSEAIATFFSLMFRVSQNPGTTHPQCSPIACIWTRSVWLHPTP